MAAFSISTGGFLRTARLTTIGVMSALSAWTIATPSTAQQSARPDSADSDKTVCELEAPWNRADGVDKRAADIKKASDWAPLAPYSNHPAGKLAGVWSFELKGIAGGGDIANAGRMVFYQEEDGRGTAPADAKWLVGGERWGHVNYGPRTSDNPEDIPPGYISMDANGEFKFPQPQYYPFPEITGRFDGAHPDKFTGTWAYGSGENRKSGQAVFTRIKPHITRIKYTSTVTDEVAPDKTGCVALDYSDESWGPGNNMRGNRPGFNIEIYGDNFYLLARDHYRLWIDPETKLELESTAPSPIFAKDENGHVINKMIGVREHVYVWPGSKWGPKTLYVEGTPVVFDYYVKPIYPFTLDRPNFKLASGYYPEKPAPGRLTALGFRLVDLPGYAVKDTVLRFRFFDAKTMHPAPGVRIHDKACSENGEGGARCEFDEIPETGVGEIEFKVPMPDSGLMWAADWTTQGDADGGGQIGTIEADNSPQIYDAFSVSDQTGAFRPQTRDFLYPYPTSGTFQQKREVILFGKNLPQKFGDETNIESLDPAITYTPRFGVAYTSRYDAAWADLSKRYKLPIEKLKANYQLLLLDVQINGRPLPGEKALKLNGALANWDLRFGGLSAAIEFIRVSGTAEPDDVLDSAYTPERIRVRITTSAPLPVNSLPIKLRMQRTNRDVADIAAGGAKATTLVTKATTAVKRTAPNIYMSPPIRLVDKGNSRLSPPPEADDIPVNIFLNGRGADQLNVEIDPLFAAKSFAMPILPAAATLPVSRSPIRHRSVRDPIQEADYLFKSALVEAAQCDGVEVEDWDKLSKEESENFYNLVVITHGDHLRKTTVKFGDHAAMLLMRKMFVEMLNDEIIKSNEILQSQLALKGFLKTMRLELDNENIPINRIKVTAPDGTRVEYGSTALVEDVDFLAKQFNSTPEKMAEWRLTATAEALSQISAGASEAAEKARQVDKCDAEDLLELTSVGFDAVAAKLKPRLMRLTESRDDNGRTRLYWERDIAARYWVDHVASVAKRLAAQRQVAKDDNLRLMIAFGLATAPVMAGGGPVIALSLAGADLSMLGADIASEWLKVYSSKIELDFSRDAAVVLGFERNNEAIRKAVDWEDAYNRTLIDVGFGALVVLSVREEVFEGLMRSKSLFAKGRTAVREMPEGGLRALGAAERRDAEIFAMRAKAREIAVGAEALDSVERRAIMAVEEDFRAARTELIHQVESGETLGFGDVITLPPGFNQKTAIVRFEPVELASAGSSRSLAKMGDEASVAMDRVVSETGETVVGAARTRPPPEAPPPPPPPTPAGPAVAPPEVVDRLEILLDNAIWPVERARALTTVGEIRVQPSLDADFIHIVLGDRKGYGSFAVALHSPTPYANFRTLVKVNFGGHKAAEIFGETAIKRIGSRNIVIPEEVMEIEIPAGALGHQRHFKSVSIVENLGDTGEDILRTGPFSAVQRKAIGTGVYDINDAGYVVLDLKPNNFSLPQRDGAVKFGMFDFGGIARVKGGNPALAREIQDVVSGPWENVRAGLLDMGVDAGDLKMSFRWTARKELIVKKYGDMFEDIDKLGVKSFDKLEFKPTAGDTLGDEVAQMFTPEARSQRTP